MGLFAVRRGRSPNCSATGSVVGLALLSLTAAAAVVNAFADRFARWADGGDAGADRRGEEEEVTPKLRREDFGAILSWHDPPALLYLDASGTRDAVAAGVEEVGSGASVPGGLSAPTEVHLGVTDHCTAGCTGCYLGTQLGRDDREPEGWRAHLDALAEMGVFEVALGGGESLHGPLPFQIGRYARSLGMVPNLTTSGLGVTVDRAADLASVMGQVNISLDGLGDTYRSVRGWNGAEVGLRALRRLVGAGARVGVNTVIVQQNVNHLLEMAEVLATLGIEEWQWLRFKPSGRGVDTYERMRLTPAQGASLWPLALQIQDETGLKIRFDCAMVPHVVSHQPPLEALVALGISGCPGGQSLWTVSSAGEWLPCSFAEGLGSAGEGTLAERWQTDPGLVAWRDRAAAPPEPCASCLYRRVCRGGCRVVAAHLTGDPMAPDPECPRVIAS
jgi:radical SAM protein with 4Fe4S-binding SPASM domain